MRRQHSGELREGIGPAWPERRESHAARRAIVAPVAGVDSGNQLVAFERMDGADLVTISMAKDKAFSALVNHMPTSELGPLVQPGTEFYGYDSLAGGRMIVFGGRLPIEIGGVLVGAVGVSGGSSEQDEACARAGLAMWDLAVS
jgi:uncharacterized protein GlcG (DUF336 family)